MAIKYIKSNIDGQEYLVRDLQDKQTAANMLATLKRNILTFSDYLYQNGDTKYKDYQTYIEQLHKCYLDIYLLLKIVVIRMGEKVCFYSDANCLVCSNKSFLASLYLSATHFLVS